MRVLVTGGAGYIGSVAVEQAQAAGHDVAILDSLWRGHRGAVPADAALYDCDLRDGEAVRRAIADFRPQAVMHFAAATLVPESMENPQLYFDVNVVGSHQLLSACLAEGVERGA